MSNRLRRGGRRGEERKGRDEKEGVNRSVVDYFVYDSKKEEIDKVPEQENKIYVGNIEFSVTDEELRKFFEEKGMQVKEATIIKDRYTGRSKGFGFVEMASGEEVENAIQSLDGQELNGRKLKISKARKPKNDRFKERR